MRKDFTKLNLFENILDHMRKDFTTLDLFENILNGGVNG